MKKNEVKIGEAYMAKVTNDVVPVRIDSESPTGGWSGKNIATGRKVQIKSAQRLRRKCTEADLSGLGRPKPKQRRSVAPKATASPTSTTGAKTSSKAAKEAKSPPAPTRAKQGDTAAKPKEAKMSALDAAAKVLAEAKEPMAARAIVDAAFAKNYWKSDGLTPWATLYSAMIREISTKGQKSRFERGDRRGTFRTRRVSK